MKSKLSTKNIGNILGIISFTIPLINFMFILNWFFEITPYQKLEGMPLLLTPLFCPIGLLFGGLSMAIIRNKLAKYSIIFNIILITLPFLYWTLGTLIFGPWTTLQFRSGGLLVNIDNDTSFSKLINKKTHRKFSAMCFL